MTCIQASEITAYLQGEGSEEDRAMLRSHFDQCDLCARDLAQSERAFGALGTLRTVDPSPDFRRRAEEAFRRAHPQFGRRRFRLLPRLAAAAALMLVAGGAVLLLRPAGPDTHLGTVAPAIPREADPEYVVIPKSTRPKTIDAAAWGEAAAVDRRLLESIRAPRAWGREISAALAWLSARQEADGSWKGGDAYETVELTGLAVLALNGTNDPAARRGVGFLVSRQRDSGALGGGSPESHAIATLALEETLIRTGASDLKRPAAAAVSVISAQNREGPWGRGPVAAWQYHVLRVASAAGDPSLLPALVRGYDAPGSGLWTDPSPDRESWAGRVAGLLSRSPIPGTGPGSYGSNDLRLAYFGTTLLRPLEGDAWTKWWSPLRSKLVKTQGADGSWPEGFEPGKGKLYATAFATLILETPERLPALGD
ncbi:MAG TPA: prenyltransferase/squalene oxidase repeat-containing protein [Planctomycetota bacterium]|nr:prenyltransferase/squalene oxidase repeat-containing protein [Planctomycetota bacterium]